MTEFIRRNEFDVTPPSVADAAEGRVVVAAGDELTVVTADGRSQSTVERPMEDIAVDRNVYVLSEDELVALTDSGMELWSREVEGAERVAATAGNVAVLTDADRLVVLDGNTSSTRFTYELPHDDLQTDGLFAAKNGFLLAAWTYLTRVDIDGREVYSANLDGQIVSVGTVGDRAVAALKDDTVRCLDQDGFEVWRREITTRALTASGTEPLLAVGDDRLRIVDERGETTSLELPTGDVVAATDRVGVVCIIDDETAGEYRRLDDAIDPEAIEVDLETDELAPDEELEFVVTNVGDTPVTTELRLDSSDVTLEDPSRIVDLRSGESSDLGATVDRVETEGPVTLMATAGDRRLTTFDRPVDRSTDPSEETRETTVDAIMSQIDDGMAHIEAAVSNDGSRLLEDVTVRPTDGDGHATRRGDADFDEHGVSKRDIRRIETGNTASVEISIPYEPGRRQTIEAVAAHPPEPTGEAVVELPISPLSVSFGRVADRRQPAVETHFQNRTEAPITDTFRFDIDEGARRFGLELTVPADGVATVVTCLAVPPEERFQVAVTADALSLEEGSRLDGWSPRGATDDLGSEISPDHDDDRDDRHSTEREVEAPASTDRLADTDMSRVGGSDETEEQRLEVERRHTDATATVDRAIEETISVQNRGETVATGVELTVGDRTVSLPDLDPEASAHHEWLHVPVAPGPVSLPEGTVRSDGSEQPLPPETVEVEPAPIRFEAAVRRGRVPELSLTVENAGRDDVRIETATLVDLDSKRQTELSGSEFGRDRTVSPSERREFTVTLPDGLPSAETDVFGFGFKDGVGNEQFRSLAGVISGGPSFEATITDAEVIEEGYSQLSVAIENTGTDQATDLRIEADSPDLDPFYDPTTEDSLDGGESTEHLVELNPSEAEKLSAGLTLTRETDTGTKTYEWTLSGPVAPTDTAWGESLREEWTATLTSGVDRADSSDIRLSTHIG